MACPFSWFSGISIVIVAIQFFRKVVPWIHENIVGPIVLGPKLKLKDYGEWALITGATDGIGKAYANHLAKHGLNVILVSRSQSKLERVAVEITSKYPVLTKTIAVDFSQGLEIFDQIEKKIDGLNIGISVNNVGISYSIPEFFLDVPNRDTTFAHIVSCNIVSVINMCRLLLPRMLAKEKGIIINIASMAGTVPSPLLTVYSASKAFVDRFSEDLSTEYISKGIIVQSVLPGFVSTNMTKMMATNLFAPSADMYVSAAIRTIGYARHTTGYLPHAFIQLVINTLYSVAPDYTNKVLLKRMQALKKKALKLNKAN